MLHFSCDLCGKDLTDATDGRYVVHMEVFAGHDPAEITDADLGDDHLEAMGELLREADAPDLEPAPAYKKLRYDLCPTCHVKVPRGPAEPRGPEVRLQRKLNLRRRHHAPHPGRPDTGPGHLRSRPPPRSSSARPGRPRSRPASLNPRYCRSPRAR